MPDERHRPIDANELSEWFRCNADVTFQWQDPPTAGENPECAPTLLVYCAGLVHDSDFRRFLQTVSADDSRPFAGLSERLDRPDKQQIVNLVFSGYVLVLDGKTGELFACNLSSRPQRTPEESNSEASIRGPRDSLIEDLDVNVALIRKRVRSTTLHYERFLLGTRSQTRVGLLYMGDIAEPELLDTVRSRLLKLQADTLLGSNQLEELLSDKPDSLFPLLDYSERPDFIVDGLLRGRFAVLLDGSTNALIGPANFMLLLKSPEDSHTSYLFAAFERLLRLFAFVCCIALTGFCVALMNYHQEQIPLSLLATIVVSRHGIPLSVPIEAFLILALFEVLREAGARLPKAVGQTLAVVGGLIIGDSAIRAGLTSPALVVIAAISTISTFVLINQTLSGAVTLLRFFVLACSSLLGIYGFFFACLSIILYMANLRSFGMPYLSPAAPLKLRKLPAALLRLPWRKLAKRAMTIDTGGDRRK